MGAATGIRFDILRLREAGMSYKQIVQELGCSLSTVSYHLGVKQTEKSLERQKRRGRKIRSYVQEFKQAAGCADCGEHYPYFVLQFDHVGTDKVKGIAQMLSGKMSIEDLAIEMAKCEVVCANCHAIRTYNRLLVHGGETMDLTELY